MRYHRRICQSRPSGKIGETNPSFYLTFLLFLFRIHSVILKNYLKKSAKELTEIGCKQGTESAKIAFGAE